MASWSYDVRWAAFQRAGGCCHLCGGRLKFADYGGVSEDGWEVDHDVPRYHGGSNEVANLLSAHGRCNRRKGARHTHEVQDALHEEREDLKRRQRNLVRAIRREELALQRVQTEQTVTAGLVGATFGAIVDKEKPVRGAIIGGALAALLVAASRS